MEEISEKRNQINEIKWNENWYQAKPRKTEMGK